MPDTGQYEESNTTNTGDRLFLTASVIGIAAISFGLGAFVVLAEVPPYQSLKNAWRAGTALWEQRTKYTDVERLDFWSPARTEQTGVTIHDQDKAQDGLTLYSSGDGPHAVLIDMDGNIVHEWRMPFSAIHDETSPIPNPQKDEFMHWHTAKMAPDGNLIVQYTAAGDTPYGYGMAKIDRNSKPIWKYLGTAHHDFSIADDGRVYALTQEFRFNTYPNRKQLRPPRLDDFAVILSPDGKEIKRVSILDALIKSNYANMVDFAPYFANEDILHTNTIQLIDDKAAANFAYGKAGDVVLSFRDLGIIAVLDMDAEKITWATRGPWLGQHDPDVLPNGEILLFDNQGQFADPDAGFSRILQIDPQTNAITWQYKGNADQKFDSNIRADQQRLANGNTLITESSGGRLLEVTDSGEIVWEFHNPIRRDDPDNPGKKLVPVVSQAERISDARADLFRTTAPASNTGTSNAGEAQ